MFNLNRFSKCKFWLIENETDRIFKKKIYVKLRLLLTKLLTMTMTTKKLRKIGGPKRINASICVHFFDVVVANSYEIFKS